VARKVLLLGLDCAPPELVFGALRPRLPTLSRLADGGIWGALKTCIPPITVPAWMVGMTGKDPGELGIYGFRNRADHSYEGLAFATSGAVREPTVWDLLGRAGRPVIMAAVPPAYPPQPLNGYAVGCFLTPGTQSRFTYPESLKGEIEGLVGEYQFDVANFRSEDKAATARRVYEMTDKRFRVFEHLLTTKPWDFAALHEIGLDRMHHGFWSAYATDHPKYVPGNPHEAFIPDYYAHLDGLVGRLLAAVPADTVVLTASDHGVKNMYGGICINEWLIQNGYLALKERPAGIARFEPALVDWERTAAWGDGGYYGRLFLNVRGREPLGTIDPADAERARREIQQGLEAIADPQGRPLGTRVYRPEEIYRAVRGVAPDLIVYFGDLDWRSVGSVGYGSIYTFDNDTGPDDANHSEDGLFILTDPGSGARGRRDGHRIQDLAPTILSLLDHPVPADMHGRAIRA
jgi:predicted AlkP superfamily phosphohydrolase/phosphomutase